MIFMDKILLKKTSCSIGIRYKCKMIVRRDYHYRYIDYFIVGEDRIIVESKIIDHRDNIIKIRQGDICITHYMSVSHYINDCIAVTTQEIQSVYEHVCDDYDLTCDYYDSYY